MFRYVILAAAVVALGGCGGNRVPLDPRAGNLAVQPIAELPPPAGTDMMVATQPYAIAPYDKLSLSVLDVKDLPNELQVDGQGNVTIPMVGEIRAAGRTPGELTTLIANALSRYIRTPQVAVNIREATGQTYSVDGQVTQPGIYPAIGNMSLVRAVASAKGTTEFAKLSDVVVFRTVNGQRMAALYNLDAIRLGRYPDPRIYPNDVVVVGESYARRMFTNLLQVLPALAAPLVVILQK